MLKIKSIKSLFEKGITKGINSIFLSNYDGSIIAKAGTDKNVHTPAAVISNIFNEYLDFGIEVLEEEDVNYIFIACEEGYIVARPIYQLILCAQCTVDIDQGMVKKMLDLVGGALAEQLKDIQQYIKE